MIIERYSSLVHVDLTNSVTLNYNCHVDYEFKFFICLVYSAIKFLYLYKACYKIFVNVLPPPMCHQRITDYQPLLSFLLIQLTLQRLYQYSEIMMDLLQSANPLTIRLCLLEFMTFTDCDVSARYFGCRL